MRTAQVNKYKLFSIFSAQQIVRKKGSQNVNISIRFKINHSDITTKKCRIQFDAFALS